MRIMKTIGLAVGVAVVLAGLHGFSTPLSLPADSSAQPSIQYQFRLVRAGVPSSCTIVKGSQIDAGLSELTVGDACDAVMPGLIAARVWRENADGSVAFASVDGPAILELALSDGLSYESFRPGAPLVALVADGN